jgi:3-phenylpropionate/trans-cinnamate dioxygenase ferredoxin subunit
LCLFAAAFPEFFMPDFVKVASTSDVPVNSKHCVKLAGKRICLVNLEGDIHAIDDTCSHAEASLCEGEIAGHEIVCPLHFATFNIMTGVATGPPAFEPIAVYQVRVNGEDIEIAV